MLAQAERLDPDWSRRPSSGAGWPTARPTWSPASTRPTTQVDRARAGARDRALQLKPTIPTRLELEARSVLALAAQSRAGPRRRPEADRRRGAGPAGRGDGEAQRRPGLDLLSHCSSARAQTAEAKLAALRSYEADPYLRRAKQTLWRLFQTSSTGGPGGGGALVRRGIPPLPGLSTASPSASSGCSPQGRQAGHPQGWELLEQFVRLTPANRRPFHSITGRCWWPWRWRGPELPDSARAVALRSRGNVTIDPTHDLAYYEAQLRAQLGDRDEAFRLLGVYLAANPQRRDGLRGTTPGRCVTSAAIRASLLWWERRTEVGGSCNGWCGNPDTVRALQFP